MPKPIPSAEDHNGDGLGILSRPRAYVRYTQDDFVDIGDEETGEGVLFQLEHVLHSDTSAARWLFTGQDGMTVLLPLYEGEGTYRLVRDVLEFTTELGARSIPITVEYLDPSISVEVWEY